MIAISVRDTGIGISAEDQARVFLEFEQADGGSTRKFGGTGLGLTISKRIIESMGGSIAVESAPGQGATFRVTIPLPRTNDTDEPLLAVPDLTGQDILIVAPAAIEASLIARRLQRWGARTKIVPDDQVAAALVPEQLWSAVLVDHTLGTAASEALARMAAAIPRRLIMITPAMRGELAGLKQAGFTGYLIKPVRAATLAARFSTDDVFDPGAAIEPAETPSVLRAGGGGLSILVAEDNEINALLARALLVKLGHHPTMVGKRHRGDRNLARGARCRHAFRPRADGPAHAGHGRPGSDAPDQDDRSRNQHPADADPGADRQRLRRGPRRLPRGRHGWFSGQAARPRTPRRGTDRTGNESARRIVPGIYPARQPPFVTVS